MLLLILQTLFVKISFFCICFFYFFYGLISFNLYYISLVVASFCVVRRAKKVLCGFVLRMLGLLRVRLTFCLSVNFLSFFDFLAFFNFRCFPSLIGFGLFYWYRPHILSFDRRIKFLCLFRGRG